MNLPLDKPTGKFIWMLVGYTLASVSSIVQITYIHWINLSDPKVEIVQSVSYSDNITPVDSALGDFKIETMNKVYFAFLPTYSLEVSNDGNGNEEELKIRIKFPPFLETNLIDESEILLFKPNAGNHFDKQSNEYYVELGVFPKGSAASILFTFQENAPSLLSSTICDTKVKIVGKKGEWKGENIVGSRCNKYFQTTDFANPVFSNQSLFVIPMDDTVNKK